MTQVPSLPPQSPRPRLRRGSWLLDWEWPALAELVAMVVFFMVVLGAALGMVLQVFSPKRRARQLGKAVVAVAQQAGRTTEPLEEPRQ